MGKGKKFILGNFYLPMSMVGLNSQVLAMFMTLWPYSYKLGLGFVLLNM